MFRTNEIPEIKAFQDYITLAQLQLRKTFGDYLDPTSKNIFDAFGVCVQHLLIDDATIFQSLSQLQGNFHELKSSLKEDILKTHPGFYKGLQLIIEWYFIKALDTYLQLSLNTIPKPEEEKSTLLERFIALKNDIDAFHKKIEHLIQESAPSYDELKKFSLDERLNYLLRKDCDLDLMRFEETIAPLEQECEPLIQRRKQLILECDQFLAEQKKQYLAEEERREKVYNTSLKNIDVYYLTIFRHQYHEIFSAFEKIVKNVKSETHKKISMLYHLILNICESIKNFENHLNDFYREETYYCLFINYLTPTNYRFVVNSLHAILFEFLGHFKKESAVFMLELHHREPYQYISESHPKIIEEIKKAFQTSAYQFLRTIKKIDQPKFIRESKIIHRLEWKERVADFKDLPSISPVFASYLVQLRRDKLNQCWRALLKDLLSEASSLESTKSSLYKRFITARCDDDVFTILDHTYDVIKKSQPPQDELASSKKVGFFQRAFREPLFSSPRQSKLH